MQVSLKSSTKFDLIIGEGQDHVRLRGDPSVMLHISQRDSARETLWANPSVPSLFYQKLQATTYLTSYHPELHEGEDIWPEMHVGHRGYRNIRTSISI